MIEQNGILIPDNSAMDIPLPIVYKWLLRDYHEQINENNKLVSQINKLKEQIKQQKLYIEELSSLTDEEIFSLFYKDTAFSLTEYKEIKNMRENHEKQIASLRETIRVQNTTISRLIKNGHSN